jgi:hypothetical protein
MYASMTVTINKPKLVASNRAAPASLLDIQRSLVSAFVAPIEILIAPGEAASTLSATQVQEQIAHTSTRCVLHRFFALPWHTHARDVPLPLIVYMPL